jgi:hypothetical protein
MFPNPLPPCFLRRSLCHFLSPAYRLELPYQRLWKGSYGTGDLHDLPDLFGWLFHVISSLGMHG